MKPLTVIVAGSQGGTAELGLMPLRGRPVLSWSVIHALEVASPQEVCVLSDRQAVLKLAESAGVVPVHCAAGARGYFEPDGAVADLVRSRAASSQRLDCVVVIDALMPLRRRGDVGQAIAVLEREGADLVLTAWPGRSRGLLAGSGADCGSLYIARPGLFDRGVDAAPGKVGAFPVEDWQCHRIAQPEDLEVAAAHMSRHLAREGPRRREVDLVVYDFDGVMTDNCATVDLEGREQVRVNRSDGLGVKAIRALGLPQLVLSTEAHPVVGARASKLGLECFQDCRDKSAWLADYCVEQGIALERVVFVGNDVNDLDIMAQVGWPLCPSDAHPRVRAAARYMLAKRGGEGIVQELGELLSQ